VIQYLGICLVILVLALVIGFVIYKKTHKDRVEVILVQERDDEDEYIPKRGFVHPKLAAPTAANFHPNRPPPFGQGGPGGKLTQPSQPMQPFPRPPASVPHQ
jgi:hypothetical protein